MLPKFDIQSKKGIDEFALVLAGGLLFIVVMLAAWGTQPTPEGNATEENITFPVVVEEVGFYEQDIPKSYWIGEFSVSYKVGSEILKTKRSLSVKKGLFTEEVGRMVVKIDPYKLENFVQTGFIIITIENTNNAGDLIIYLNDKKIRSIKNRFGEITIQVRGEDLRENNLIELKAGSPGWKFWMTTIYEIEELKFGVNVYGTEQRIVTFNVTGEQIDNFKLGRLEFEVHDYNATGDLIIKMNDNVIYEGIPQRFFTRDFTLRELGLVEGVNRITFMTRRDAYYEIDDAQLTLVHSTRGYQTLEKKFEITSNIISKFEEGGKGIIKFRIEKVDTPGTLEIIIRDSRGRDHSIYFQQFMEGLNEIYFDINSITEGTNALIFKSVDGSFLISVISIDFP